jgi:response regulator RpfG family c-di-GMP phosphodiesterase
MTFEERIELLLQSIESHDRQNGENASQIAELKDAISKLVRLSNEDATTIQALAYR